MQIVKIIAGIFFVLLGIVFVATSFGILISPPKGKPAFDIIFGTLLLGLIPLIGGAWLFKSFFQKKG
jgi:hypothetical protein